MKKKILSRGICVVEFSFHTFAVANLLFFLSDVSRSHLFVRWRGRGDWRQEFPFSDDQVEFSIFPTEKRVARASLAFYLGVLRVARSSDRVWVATGPESKIFPDLLFLIILICVKRTGMVLGIRNIDRWVVSSGRNESLDRIRASLLPRIPHLVFESRLQMTTFTQINPGYTGTVDFLPVGFSDGREIWSGLDSTRASKSSADDARLIVGLVGGLDPDRRNYADLLAALREMSLAHRARFTFRILGRTTNPDSQPILEELASLCHVDCFEAYIPSRVMLEKMEDCDVLCAPLKPGLGYGNRKGTGAIGDALISRKKLLVPDEIYLGADFDPIVLRYSSSRVLRQILVGLLLNPRTLKISARDLRQFDARSARLRLMSGPLQE